MVEARKFRAKPFEVEAVQFTGSRENGLSIERLYPRHVLLETTQPPRALRYILNVYQRIDHGQGGVTYASNGDWIVAGPGDLLYVLRQEEFNARYEAVHE